MLYRDRAASMFQPSGAADFSAGSTMGVAMLPILGTGGAWGNRSRAIRAGRELRSLCGERPEAHLSPARRRTRARHHVVHPYERSFDSGMAVPAGSWRAPLRRAVTATALALVAAGCARRSPD